MSWFQVLQSRVFSGGDSGSNWESRRRPHTPPGPGPSSPPNDAGDTTHSHGRGSVSVGTGGPRHVTAPPDAVPPRALSETGSHCKFSPLFTWVFPAYVELANPSTLGAS